MIDIAHNNTMDSERSGFRALLVLLAIGFLLGLVFCNPGWIKPDSVGVYAYLRSAAMDRDLSFLNEWRGFGLIQHDYVLFKEVGPGGRVANHWNIGTSVLAAPFFLLADALAAILGWQRDGVSGIYTVGLAWASIAFTIAALLVARLLTKRERKGSFWIAVAVVLFGTPLFFYTFRMPLGSHAAGTFAVALLTWSLVTERDVAARFSPLLPGLKPAPFLTGVLLGFAAATRLQHAALGGAVVVRGAQERWRLSDWATCAGGTLLGWSPQAVAWWVIYDHPLGPLVKGSSLAGSTWYPFRENSLLEVLYSGWHGLFSWSPVVLFAIAGWFLRSRERREAWLLIAMFAGEWFANGLLDRYFWAGMSFGPRRFVDLAVPFIIGVVWFIDGMRSTAARRAAIAAIVISTAWSSGLLLLTFDGRLDLVRSLSGGDLILSVGSLATGLPRFTPAIVRMPALHLLAGLASMTLLAIGCLLAARHRRAAITAALCMLVVVDVAIVSLRTRTRQRAVDAATRFGISPARADLGPLLDQRNLLRDLLEHRRRSGHSREVEELNRELAALDQAIASRMRK